MSVGSAVFEMDTAFTFLANSVCVGYAGIREVVEIKLHGLFAALLPAFISRRNHAACLSK